MNTQEKATFGGMGKHEKKIKEAVDSLIETQHKMTAQMNAIEEQIDEIRQFCEHKYYQRELRTIAEDRDHYTCRVCGYTWSE